MVGELVALRAVAARRDLEHEAREAGAGHEHAAAAVPRDDALELVQDGPAHAARRPAPSAAQSRTQLCSVLRTLLKSASVGRARGSAGAAGGGAPPGGPNAPRPATTARRKAPFAAAAARSPAARRARQSGGSSAAARAPGGPRRAPCDARPPRPPPRSP